MPGPLGWRVVTYGGASRRQRSRKAHYFVPHPVGDPRERESMCKAWGQPVGNLSKAAATVGRCRLCVNALDKGREQPCATPDAVYRFEIGGDIVRVKVRLPFALKLTTATRRDALENDLHDAVESVLAPYFVEWFAGAFDD